MLKKAEKLDFENDKQRLETLFNSQNLSDSDKTLKKQLSKRIQDYYCKKFDGARIRSKECKIENESPTKAFFTIEKENAARKNITQLKTENGTIIENKDEILLETQNFYKNLWETDHQIDQLAQNDYVKIMASSKFDQQDADDIEKLICENEVSLAIDQLNKDSSPGADGLTSNFYKTFKYLIISDLTEVFNNCFFKKEMSPSMKQAIIKLLYKKNDRLLLKNWRPISLLNTDYKILSKILSNRITPILNKIISSNQKCGLPGRKIDHLLYNVQAIIEIAKQKNEKFGLILIDFEKAFDRLSHEFIFKILKELGFGKIMLQWFELLYKNNISNIEINGAYTPPIKMKRGIRQGCPLSMLFFITAAEALTRKIETNSQIRGFTYQNIETKILQYADDTSFFFNDLISLKSILNELNIYEKVSGQKINLAKTQIFTNDVSLENCVKRHHPDLIFTDEIHMLGIDFNKTQDNAQSNWKKIVFRINSLATLHRERKLTLFGKVQIINTLLIPVIIHKAKILIPPPEILKQINTILYKFLWHPNPIENLSRKKLIAHKDQGGIAMIDLNSKFETCRIEKIKHLATIATPDEVWKKWAVYNLFYRIKHINKKLFINSQPHALTPNTTWNDLFQIFMKIKNKINDWDNISHKQLYLALKEKETILVNIKNVRGDLISWKDISLRNKAVKNLFNNSEKETSLRIAHDGYKWGNFNRKTGLYRKAPFKQKIQNCKFCKSENDSVHHLLLKCKYIQKIWKSIEQYLQHHKLLKTNLNKDMILYNHFENGQKHNFLPLTAVVTAKSAIITQKLMLDAKNQYNWFNQKFHDHVLWIIKTKIDLLQNESDPKPIKCI